MWGRAVAPVGARETTAPFQDSLGNAFDGESILESVRMQPVEPSHANIKLSPNVSDA
jgi:hypothetical protein